MKLIVGINNIEVDESDSFNQGEYNIHKVEYEFDEVYNNLVKMATFSDENGSYAIEIENNECTIPYEILKTEGLKEFGVFGYELEDEELKLRYSPAPIKRYVDVGSYKEEFDNYEKPTPTDLEQIREDIVEIKSNITTINNDIIEIGEDVVNIEGDIDGIEEDIESLKDRVTNLEEDMGNVSTALDSINGEVI
jgi:hypothetical protein